VRALRDQVRRALTALTPIDRRYNPRVNHVGVFDSGVGGLSVLRELRSALPDVPMTYVADSKHVPYGGKSPETIRERSTAIARFLVDVRHATALVVACNTATTHSIDALRRDFPAVPIVGMEPAIKPAANATRSGVVGILATGATLTGQRVASLIERNSAGIEVITQPCPGLVEQVERGDLRGPQTLALLRDHLDPLLARGADAIVLGCTHYDFLRPAIAEVAGPSVMLFDSGAAVARQARKVLPARDDQPIDATKNTPSLSFFTSGNRVEVRGIVEQLWGEPIVDLQQFPA
jgi:glutamate racemase